MATVQTVTPEPPAPTFDILGLTREQAQVIHALIGAVNLNAGPAGRTGVGRVSEIYYGLGEQLFEDGSGWLNPYTVDGTVRVMYRSEL